MPGTPHEFLIESDTDNQIMIVEFNGKMINLDFGPAPTWPTKSEIEQFIGHAVMSLLDPNWEDE